MSRGRARVGARELAKQGGAAAGARATACMHPAHHRHGGPAAAPGRSGAPGLPWREVGRLAEPEDVAPAALERARLASHRRDARVQTARRTSGSLGALQEARNSKAGLARTPTPHSSAPPLPLSRPTTTHRGLTN